MTQKKPPAWIYLCVFLTSAVSLASMYYRHKEEQGNRTVAIAAEYDTVQALAASQSLTPEEGLAELKRNGLTAVVIPEQYVSELFAEGDLQVIDGKYVTGEPDSIARLLRGVRIRFPKFVTNEKFVAATQRETAIEFSDLSMVRTVSVGLNPEAAESAKASNLEVIARCVNPLSASADTVTQTIAWARELGADTFLPEGTQVLGRRNAMKAFTDALKEYDIYYASPEFSKIGGDEDVVKEIPEQVVRLHSAQGDELDKMQIAEAVDRYAKAARERNQRILLLRPLSSASSMPLSDFAEFVKQVKDETEKEGGIVGEPHPFKDPRVPSILFPLIGLSLVPLAAWTAFALLPKRWLSILVGIVALALGALCFKATGPFRQIDALLAALILPTAAFVIIDVRQGKSLILEFIVITLISLTGGLAVAGLLNSLPFFAHAKQFEGVKFAHFLPIAVVGAYFFHRFGLVRKSLTNPMEWGKTLLALLVLIALAFMIARTGNDNPAAVSDTELKMRAFLDTILFVRPRTKEFLIGHPFLIIGLGMLISIRKGSIKYQNWKGWITLFLMLGAIGQTSIVNTMCHIHTPLTISLARIGVGLISGGIIGVAVWWLLDRSSDKLRPVEGI
jgi:hypothetical protein